ncbi:MAG: GntR family transcriptional regulator [Euzebyales bacterium]|nr:GntR family transcriptional regulator [Euzebyales bacterium]
MDAAGGGAANETSVIPRRTLRQDVGDRLRDRLVQGELQAGEHINESTLSLELGVSRTPLREALLLLERDGLIRSEPAKGFTVSPLTSAEVLEVYPVMWTLEGLALRLSGDAALSALPQLRDLLRRFEAADTARVARNLDNAWHASLLSACPNRRLLELIAQFKRITQRYWVVYMRDTPPIAHSAAQHSEVLEALAAGDMTMAAARLEAHWEAGMVALLQRMSPAPAR